MTNRDPQPDTAAGPPREAGGPSSLARLLETFTAWSSADVLDGARRRAQATGDTARVEALTAMVGDAPPPIEALAAQHELADLLTEWRWHTVCAAREGGATWADVGAATRSSPEQARQDYLDAVYRAVDHAAAYPTGFQDAERYLAAAEPSDQDQPMTQPPTDTHDHRDHEDLEPTRTATPAAQPESSRNPAELAETVDARMSAEPPTGRADGFDLDKLDALTAADGSAVFDPTAPGGVRHLTDTARAILDAAAQDPPEREAATVHQRRARELLDHALDPGAAVASTADRTAAMVDEVRRRTDDPDFAFDPAAEWGQDTYREPRSDEEAAARTAHLDAQRATGPAALPAPTRAPTELEDALGDAQQRATLAERAYDPYPAAWPEIDNLEALQDLRPTPEPPRASGSEAREVGGEDAAFDEPTLGEALDAGPWTDERGRQWESLGQWAATTVREDAALGRPSRPDDPAQVQQRLDDARARLAAREQTTVDDAAGTEQRRGQLARWHDDDSSHHTSDENADDTGDQGGVDR